MKQESISEKHLSSFKSILDSIHVTDRTGYEIKFHDAINDVCTLIETQVSSAHTIMFIGNGGSAAISSHMAIDFWKNGCMKAIAFNDSSLLTCISNDFGYKRVFEKPIEMFANEGDILCAISSSGNSENIINGVHVARNKGCNIITFSGFKETNTLRLLGDYNYYVPSCEYGQVEVTHQYICHCILDIIIYRAKQC
ncbi:MAG: SIS domain-containing protein [Nitrospirae bacterium]|nr:SIS domain-containing protein [Nitrospirota bacterium]